MMITAAEISALEGHVNAKLAKHNAKFVMTVHFAADRLNDPRNIPPISLGELEDLFDRLIGQHIASMIVLKGGDTFNIRCLRSDINMPCAVQLDANTQGASATRKFIIITIMRKHGFKSKDPIEFKVR